MSSVRHLLASLLVAAIMFASASSHSAGPSLDGRLLVASPEMRDPTFKETVLLIVEHSSEGAFGLILNKVIGSGGLGGLLNGFGIDTSALGEKDAATEVALRSGGPVQPELVFVLHSPDFEGGGGELVIDGVVLTRNVDVLEAIAAGEGPRHSLYIVGYSGWSEGQLDREIERGDWLDAPAVAPVVFGSSPDSMWRNVMEAAGLSL